MNTGERLTKVTVLSLVALLVLLSLLAGCGTQPSASPSSGEELQKTIVFSGSGATGTAWILSGGFANILNKYTSIQASFREAPGYKGTAPLMNKEGGVDAVQLTPTQPLAGYMATHGYEKKYRIRNLISARAPGVAYFGLFTTPDRGIKTVADIRGKRFLADFPAVFWTADIADSVLSANGMTRNDVKWMVFEGFDAAIREVIEGRADAYVGVAGSTTEELARQKGLYVIPLTSQEQAAINKANPAMVGGKIPAGFGGAPVETPVVLSPECFFVRPDMNNITAYTMVKAFLEHIQEFWIVHQEAPGFTKENAIAGWVVPYHPGAIKYYKEIGIWTKDADAEQVRLLQIEKGLYGDVPDIQAFKDLGIPVN